MSWDAKTLLHWSRNMDAARGQSGNEYDLCRCAAREWANYIISGESDAKSIV